jgi:hypothetical protein
LQQYLETNLGRNHIYITSQLLRLVASIISSNGGIDFAPRIRVFNARGLLQILDIDRSARISIKWCSAIAHGAPVRDIPDPRRYTSPRVVRTNRHWHGSFANSLVPFHSAYDAFARMHWPVHGTCFTKHTHRERDRAIINNQTNKQKDRQCDTIVVLPVSCESCVYDGRSNPSIEANLSCAHVHTLSYRQPTTTYMMTSLYECLTSNWLSSRCSSSVSYTHAAQSEVGYVRVDGDSGTNQP